MGQTGIRVLARTDTEAGQMELPLEPVRLIYQVSELNAAVERLFEANFRAIWVVGEISGCNLAASGHHYFCLKDEHSQIKCVLFKGSARFAKFKPRDGLSVLARGSLEVYEARGEYQLIVDLLEPRGAGTLQLAFEQLKQKLAAEGLFDRARKRALPKMPRRIGIVTSPAGAVIRDILHVLERRMQGLHVRLFPAQVQGPGSVEQVCGAIRYFSNTGWAEVIIVARGGGSLEDLWTFNEETVARAIAASKVPVISAIGHETDFTIADFVADYRAPTPSAAAEIVINTRESLLEQVNACRAKAIQAVRYRLLASSRDLHQRGADRAHALIERALGKRAQRVDELETRLRDVWRHRLDLASRRLGDMTRRLHASDLRLRFAHARSRLQFLDQQLERNMSAKLWHRQRRHEGLDLHLRQLSPLAVLGRGYAIVQRADEQVVRSSAEVTTGEALKIRLSRGGLDAIVSNVHEQ